jgi:hypothetical protein
MPVESLSLFLVSAAAGIALLSVFRKTSDQAAIRRTRRRLQAHLLEIRLYGDDPAIVWQAQKSLLAANARYFLLMLRPAAVLTLPMLALFVVLDGFYGRRPLNPGETAIVTVQLRRGGTAPHPIRLDAPDGIAVESPPVRVLGADQVSWRIRAARPVSGELRLTAGPASLTKSIVVAAERRFVSTRRVRRFAELVFFPGERPLPGGEVEWIELGYPAARVRTFGFETHWLVWFLLISMVSALLVRRRLRVAL